MAWRRLGEVLMDQEEQEAAAVMAVGRTLERCGCSKRDAITVLCSSLAMVIGEFPKTEQARLVSRLHMAFDHIVLGGQVWHDGPRRVQ